MTRPHRLPDPLAPVGRHRGVRWAGALRLVLAVAALACVSTTGLRSARAEDAPDLSGRILGADPAARAAALKLLEGRPTQIVEVLGPVLRAPDAKAAAPAVAAWLAERLPTEPEPPLFDEIVRRAEADADFARAVAAVASPNGWGRLVEGARTRARDASPGAAAEGLRRGAIALLAADPHVPSMLDLADVWACDGTLSVRNAARDRLAESLAYAFPTPEAARTWLAARTEKRFLDVVRELSARKDTPDYPAYQRLVEESRASIERVKTLKDLASYLRPRTTPWPEVRRIAARQAASVTAEVEEWRALLADLLHDEDDREALASILDAIVRIGDASALRAPELADAVLLRMEACCNAPALLRGLLDLLAKVGTTDVMKKARAIIDRTGDPALQIAWIGAAAAVGGLAPELSRIHQLRSAADDEMSVAVRVKAIESLAAGRGDWKDRAVARDYLYGILRRDDSDAIVASMPKETVPAARAAAIRSLESFPSDETYARLVRLSATPPELPEHAQLAVSVLTKLASKDPIALRALVQVAGDAAASPKVRAEALVDAAKLAADASAGPDVRAGALPVVRAAAEAAESVAVRVAAVEAAALLADEGTLDTAVRLAARLRADGKPEAASAEQALVALVVALARDATGAHDARLGDALRELGKSPASLDVAVAASDDAVDQGEARLALQTTRAVLRLERARTASDVGVRRTALEESHRILRSALKAVDRSAVEPASLTPSLAAQVSVCEELLRDAGVKDTLRRSALVAILSAAREWAAADPTMRAAIFARAEPWLAPAKAVIPATDDDAKVIEAFEKAVKAPPLPPR